jgi:hypothetical protein
MWQSKIAIRGRDTVLASYQSLRLGAHRLLHGIRFVDPIDLPEELRTQALIQAQQSVVMPSDFLRLRAATGRPSPVSFPPEIAYRCHSRKGLRIRAGRFIEIGDGRYMDAGKQVRHRYRQLERAMESDARREDRTTVFPWGLGYASYGDFLIQVLPKLARLLAALPADERHKALVCLPEFAGLPWACEYLDMMGIGRERRHEGDDSLLLSPGTDVVVGSGPSAESGIAHPHDISLMLSLLSPRLPRPSGKPTRRLYISRRMGRTMENEEELIPGLVERGFEILALERLSVSDQIMIFQEAAMVVGPHGAGHANVMWSAPGTHLLEVFHPSWMHPCYALLCGMRGIRYHCLVGESGTARGRWTEKSRYGIFMNPRIKPSVFFGKIDQIDKWEVSSL